MLGFSGLADLRHVCALYRRALGGWITMIELPLNYEQLAVIVYALKRLQSDESANSDMQDEAESLLNSFNFSTLTSEEEE